MQKANAVGGLLTMLLAIIWILVGMADWPAWIGVIASVAVAAYWAFGRRLVVGDEFPSRDRSGRQERRDRSRNRGVDS